MGWLSSDVDQIEMHFILDPAWADVSGGQRTLGLSSEF
jgi:hypothetical protein